MKKLFLTVISAFVLIGALSVQPVQGQVCTPDPAFTAAGVYPATLPPACANVAYSVSITLVIPPDTIFPTPFGPITVPIDSVVLDSVVGLPPGLTYQCEPATCAFPGGASYCILVSGTSSAADTFSIDIFTNTYLTVIGTQQVIPTNFTNYYDLIVNPGVSGNVSVSDANCGASDGVALVSPSGTGPFTFLWSNGDTSATTDNLAPGVYTVVVTGPDGCSSTFTANIGTTGNAPSVVLDSTAWSGCAGSMGGSLSISASGGAGSYAYLWSTGATTATLSGVAGGTYSVTVTDTLGCATSISYTITEPAPLAITPDVVTPASCYGETDGAASIAVSGGIGNYTYAWQTNPAQMTSVATGLAAGIVQVLVTDEVGCVEDLNVTVGQPDSLELSFTKVNPGFGTYGSATVTPTGGTPPYTYLWDSGDTANSIDSVSSLGGVFYVTVTDVNGCEVTDSVEIDAYVSIEDELAAGFRDISIYPNPNNGAFTLDLALDKVQQVNIQIFDLAGKVVLSSVKENVLNISENITVQGIPAGMYLLQIRTETGIASRRVIIR
ncbi:MAG: T9SS type A sorting domain-containing protein [Bacteroidia bacterium]|nr:T9SS type A sorting domain-containing protein [Bacteroidia bacterium]